MGGPDKIGQFIILFDGVCNLCNRSVQFVIKKDKRNKFLFASLQSSFGQQQLKKIGIDGSRIQTVVLLKEGQVFQKSNAVFEIVKELNGIWPLLYGLKIFPRFIRDFVYDLISKNRYRFFGKRESCMIPSEELKAKFIQ